MIGVREIGWHGLGFRGPAPGMPGASADLTRQVRSVLVQSGFHVVSDAGGDVQGLRVTQTDAGVSVSWTASGGSPGLPVNKPAMLRAATVCGR